MLPDPFRYNCPPPSERLPALVEVICPAALKLPEKLPVPVILAPVLLIIIVLLPPAVNVMFALEVIAIFEVPFWNVAPLMFEVTFMLPPASISPVILAVPAMLAPVLVTTNTFGTPFELILTLPAAAGILTFELPLEILLVLTVDQLNVPVPLVCKY